MENGPPSLHRSSRNVGNANIGGREVNFICGVRGSTQDRIHLHISIPARDVLAVFHTRSTSRAVIPGFAVSCFLFFEASTRVRDVPPASGKRFARLRDFRCG